MTLEHAISETKNLAVHMELSGDPYLAGCVRTVVSSAEREAKLRDAVVGYLSFIDNDDEFYRHEYEIGLDGLRDALKTKGDEG